ncbi:uncharacterized protein I303_108660 [Kwoniella dejecticola CBS 10117]|uniref:Ubiquitin fusion degradation protein 1 n=1 Tax=Kwoniella dejecticola CBS 10117 TaxID=1296121 RepID=A0A1A5ZWS3_9TREE|nr:ubiquitin fusion degradation protein 1 [Kwoniella dejecticola CBS 10117]OBR82256.1 ubiquitin fusion degradation protein 1 [Kwoniella dejecticola CBS 10117]
MNHGYDDSDEEYDYATPPVLGGGGRGGPPAGPSALLSQLMGGMGGMGRYSFRAPPPSAFDEYYKAYSVAVMGGRERPELMYGGKIIMPPGALAKLTALDISSPWTFQLRNPRNPTVHQTHAGVLEFIADEGIVHLPAWMMKTLNLTEGDPIRLTGAKLPKGKMVKIQAQSTDFLQVSDAKAVLESALRFYSVLTKNDIIEITYNSLIFEFLIMETYAVSGEPASGGISVIDTDLEVDFETPVGYVEPPRPAPAPIPTMADKLKIDLSETHTVSAGSSRPGTSLSNRSGGDSSGGQKESFTGVGQSLSGKKVKGKGLAKKIEQVDESSKINRNDGPRIITPESLADDGRKIPAALVLPQGKFFFGFKYIEYDPSKAPKPTSEDAEKNGNGNLHPFGGSGQTLKKAPPKGTRSPFRQPSPPPPSTTTVKGKEKADGKAEAEAAAEDKWAKLGNGNTLSTSNKRPKLEEKEEARTHSRQEVIDATMLDEDDFMFDGGDGSEDDGDDVIDIDSD